MAEVKPQAGPAPKTIDLAPNLDTPAPSISLDFGPTVNITQGAADNRAEKYNYTLGQDSIGTPALSARIKDGDEQSIRDFQAQKLDLENESLRLQMVQKAAPSLTPQDFGVLDALTAASRNDPNTTMEREFSKKVFSDLYYNEDDGVYDKSLAHDPIETYRVEEFAQERMANAEILRKAEEDLGIQRSQMSILGRLGDFAENLIPFKSWYNLQNSLVDLPNAPFLLGNNLAEGVQWANSLSPEEYARVIPQAIAKVAETNVGDAQTLVEALRAYSLSDAGWGNLQSLGDLSTVADVGSAGIGVVRGAVKAGARTGAREASQEGFTTAAGRVAGTAETPSATVLPGPRITSEPGTPIPFERRRFTPANRNAALGQEGKKFIQPQLQGPKALVKPGAQVALNDNVPTTALKAAVKDTVDTATLQAKNDVPELLSTAGKTDAAVGEQVAKEARLADNAPTFKVAVDDPIVSEQRQALLKNLPMNSNPLDSGAFSLNREVMTRVKDRMYGTFGKMLTGLSDFQSLERLSAAQQNTAIQVALSQVKRDYPSTSNAIHGIDWMSGENNPENIHRVALTFKRPDGAPFSSYEKAKYFAENEARFKENYSVIPNGNGYVVQLSRAVDETHPDVRNAIIETKNTTPSGFGKMGTGGNIRTANDLLSMGQNAVRKVLVHGIQKPGDLLYEASQPIRSLSKSEHGRFTRFTEMMRDYVSPSGQRGVSFQTQGDLESAWQGAFGHLPSEKETKAFWAYQNLMDWDYVTRNLLLYRQKARAGIEEISMPHFDGQQTFSFEGKAIDGQLSFDDIDGNAGVYYYDAGSKKSQFFYASDLDKQPGLRSSLRDMIDSQGHKLIQVADPYAAPLKEATGEGRIVNFVITKDYKRNGLSFKQIDYNPGGHVIYDNDHWIKQPKFVQIGKRRVYTGDTTIRPANTSVLASEYAGRYEKARQLLKDKKLTELSTYVKGNLFEDMNEFLGYFNSGRLDVNTPITSVSRVEKSINNPTFKAGLGAFEDAVNDKYNITGRMGLEFLGDRNLDIQAIASKSVGSDGNPLLALTTPRLIDPLSSVERATANLSNNLFLQDYRTLSAEHFIKEFADVLKYDLDRAEINPVAILMDKNPFRSDGDQIRIAAARNYQSRVTDLLGVRTETAKQVDAIKEKLYNSVYHKLGEKNADRLDEYLLSRELNPVHFFRKAAFAMKLGLFNPLQLLKQSQTLGMIYALSPRNALKATPAYPLVQALRLSSGTPEMISHAAGIASKMGWKADDFKEWYQAYVKSGLNDIKGEHAYKDRLNDPQIFRGAVGSMLDKHTIFFDEGERTHRIVGSATAYLEWREKNPLKKLDRRAWTQIMLRQDDLTQNMTKASNAAWQKGVFSVPTQFASYQIRLWESMMGTRLTRMEKARVLLVQSALYGTPIGVAGTLIPVWPFYEDIRKNRLAHEAPTDNFAIQAFHNGITSAAIQAITGTEYNVGEALGPTGLTMFRDAWTGDKTTVEILSGAAGGTGYEVMKSTLPALTDAIDIFRNGGTEGKTSLLMTDLLNAARNISSVNYATKLVMGMNLQKYISKSGTKIDSDVTGMDSLMNALGIDKMSTTDIYKMTDLQKEVDQVKNQQRTAYVKAMQGYWNAIQDDEGDSIRDAYWNRAQEAIVLGGFTPDEFSGLWMAATKGNESLVDSVNTKFLLKKAPPEDAEARRERYFQGKE